MPNNDPKIEILKDESADFCRRIWRQGILGNLEVVYRWHR